MGDQWAIDKGRKTLGSQSIRINHLQDWIERDSLVADAISGTRRVPCPAGSLLLWDSRTIHQGWSGGPRLAQPICYEPKERRTPEARLRKLLACANGLPTTHSSTEGRISWAKDAQQPATVPWCVAPDCEALWTELQKDLWIGKMWPAKMARCLTKTQALAIEAVLRPEVVA